MVFLNIESSHISISQHYNWTIDDVTWTVFLHFIGNSFFHWPMWLSIDSLLKINHRYHSCLPNKKLSICSMGLEYLPTMDRQRLQSHEAFGLAVAAQGIGVLELWTFFSFCKSASLEVPWFPMKRRGTCCSYPGICLKRYWLVCKNGGFNELLNYFCLWLLEDLRFWFNLFQIYVQVVVSKICLFPSLGRWTKLTNMFKDRLKPPTRDGLKLPPR